MILKPNKITLKNSTYQWQQVCGWCWCSRTRRQYQPLNQWNISVSCCKSKLPMNTHGCLLGGLMVWIGRRRRSVIISFQKEAGKLHYLRSYRSTCLRVLQIGLALNTCYVWWDVLSLMRHAKCDLHWKVRWAILREWVMRLHRLSYLASCGFDPGTAPISS